MARILYWNIDDFGTRKINDQRVSLEPNTAITKAAASAQRSQYIIDTLTENTPDIFVIVETITNAGSEGALISGRGATGAQLLLTRIRTALGNNWRMVPPLRLGDGGQEEGISVYFNSANLIFTGPWHFQGAAHPSASTPPAAGGIAYTGAWANCLPATNVPAGQPNAGIPSNELAGQWMYTLPLAPGTAGPPTPLRFPGINNRPPFLTTFWDTVNNRALKLLSFHASPNAPAAQNGTNEISRITEMTSALVGNEAQVIVGDFNVNIFDPLEADPAYDNIIAAGYTRQINPTADQWPDKGYISTKIIGRNQATPWNTNGYPGYGYAGSTGLGVAYSSIDNILTRGGAASNFTIVNRVSGTPYSAIDPSPNNAPIGHYEYTTGMEKIIGAFPIAGRPFALPLPPEGPAGGGGTLPPVGAAPDNATTSFREWPNYGRIRSTSDHIALVVDI